MNSSHVTRRLAVERLNSRLVLASSVAQFPAPAEIDVVDVRVRSSMSFDYYGVSFSDSIAGVLKLGASGIDGGDRLVPAVGFEETLIQDVSEDGSYILVEEFDLDSFVVRFSVRRVDSPNTVLFLSDALEVYGVSNSGQLVGLFERNDSVEFAIDSATSHRALIGDVVAVNSVARSGNALLVAGEIFVAGEFRAAVWNAFGEPSVLVSSSEPSSASAVIGNKVVGSLGPNRDVYVWNVDGTSPQALLDDQGQTVEFDIVDYDDQGAILGMGPESAFIANVFDLSSAEPLEQYLQRVYALDVGEVFAVQAIDRSGSLETLSFTADDFTGVIQGIGYQNGSLREDVNGDGIVSPLDALLVINRLNRFNRENSGFIQEPPQGEPFFVDTNGDGWVSAIDALIVINYLNRKSRFGGEGEFTPYVAASYVEPHVKKDPLDVVWEEVGQCGLQSVLF